MTNSQNEAATNKSRKNKLIITLLCILGVILILITSVFVIIFIGNKRLHSGEMQVSAPDGVDAVENEDYIEYEGKKYVANKNVTSVLFLGIDKENINNEKNAGSNGQADAIFLACIDTKTGSVKIIPINRDTMADISVYSSNGKYSGTKNTQICLSYAYGSNAKESCKNVCRDVSRLLCGVNINSYAAIDLEGVSAITDIMGGVELTSIETIGDFTEGKTVNLKGKKAVSYIQQRGDDVYAATRRMARQKQFLSAFASKAGNQLVTDFSKLSSFYNIFNKYTVTDIDFSKTLYLAKCVMVSDLGSSIEYLNIDGQAVAGKEHVEFYADNNSIYRTVLDCFYNVIE